MIQGDHAITRSLSVTLSPLSLVHNLQALSFQKHSFWSGFQGRGDIGGKMGVEGWDALCFNFLLLFSALILVIKVNHLHMVV